MQKKIVQPTFNRVLIHRHAATTEMKGFVVPEQSVNKPNEGTVVALGPGVINSSRFAQMWKGMTPEASGVQVINLGDHVLFGNYAGKEVEVNEGETFVLLQQDEIEAVIRTVEWANENEAPSVVQDEGRPA